MEMEKFGAGSKLKKKQESRLGAPGGLEEKPDCR